MLTQMALYYIKTFVFMSNKQFQKLQNTTAIVTTKVKSDSTTDRKATVSLSALFDDIVPFGLGDGAGDGDGEGKTVTAAALCGQK